MLIETNPCENCDFTPAVCDCDIEICQLTRGNSCPISSEQYEKEKEGEYRKIERKEMLGGSLRC